MPDSQFMRTEGSSKPPSVVSKNPNGDAVHCVRHNWLILLPTMTANVLLYAS